MNTGQSYMAGCNKGKYFIICIDLCRGQLLSGGEKFLCAFQELKEIRVAVFGEGINPCPLQVQIFMRQDIAQLNPDSKFCGIQRLKLRQQAKLDKDIPVVI